MSEFELNGKMRAEEFLARQTETGLVKAARYVDRLKQEAASVEQIADFFKKVNNLVELGSRSHRAFQVGADSFMVVFPYEKSFLVGVEQFDLSIPRHSSYCLDVGPDYLNEMVATGQLELHEKDILNAEYVNADGPKSWIAEKKWLPLPAQTARVLLEELTKSQEIGMNDFATLLKDLSEILDFN